MSKPGRIDYRRLALSVAFISLIGSGYFVETSNTDPDLFNDTEEDQKTLVQAKENILDSTENRAIERMPDTVKDTVKYRRIPYPSVKQDPRPSFPDWIEQYKRYAIGQGIDSTLVEQAFDGVEYNQGIVRLDRNQPEFTWTFEKYRDRLLHPYRIQQGKKHAQKHTNLLRDIEREKGVPASILVAIKGIESNYGQNQGSYDPIEAAATLTYEGRREDLFRQQLISILRLQATGRMPFNAVSSSHTAGTAFQFLPSTEEKFAIDGNENGTIDMRGEVADGFASVANYLISHGWKKGEPVLIKIDSRYSKLSGDWDETRKISDWADKLNGIPDHILEKHPELHASLLDLSADNEDPYLVLAFENNFGALLAYNWSQKYAYAITGLANEITGGQSSFYSQVARSKIGKNTPAFH